MLARDLISDSIPSVKMTDKVGRVMGWMSEFKVGQLPIVENETNDQETGAKHGTCTLLRLKNGKPSTCDR